MSTLSKAKTTIELNGKLYDARSGKVIDSVMQKSSVKQSASQPVPKKAVDGFTRPAKATPAQPPHSSVEPHQDVKKNSINRTKAADAKTNLEKSKTLMRPAVKKPQAITKPIAGEVIAPGNLKKQDHGRTYRASQIEKSNFIQKFNNPSQHKVVKKTAPLAVATKVSHPNDVSHGIAQIAIAAETQIKQSVDIIEESLRNASSHLETFEGNIKRSALEKFGFRNKAANLASLSFAGLLLVGFFAYQNGPNIQMRVAASQSGVAASMPGYKPAGFSPRGGVQSSPGKVSVKFNSNSDDRQFTVTQQASNWSSDSLLNNHVASSKQPYQTYQENGKTVYIFDNSNATWVNGGVWYSVDGDASLTSDQLLRLANSL